MSINYKDIGERIKEARISKGMSQQELGIKVSLSTTAIALYESGERKLKNLDLISKISKELNVSLKELIENYNEHPIHVSFRASPSAMNDPKFVKAMQEIMKKTNEQLSDK